MITSFRYGEGFNYEASSASYWLLEISGMPHGLNGDMLRYAGMTPQHFRGMLFGNANRWQCALNEPVGGTSKDCPFDPRSIWSLWKTFDISEATMHGFWLAKERSAAGTYTAPVAIASATPASGGAANAALLDAVKLTSFVRVDAKTTLVVVASWATEPVTLTFAFDWAALGIDAAKATMRLPKLIPMQVNATSFSPTGHVPLPALGGFIALLEEQ